jgi:sterol desaturase/sphingolipid hydroxylase (fatty acid hydroxylase superfamily)
MAAMMRPIPISDARGTPMTHPTRRRPWWRSRWWMPLFSLLLGGLVFAAMAIGGSPGDGVKGLAVMTAVAAVFWFGGRSDTVRGLGGPGRDERWSMIDLRATAFAGVVVLLALTGAWLWELAQGDDGSPYGQVMAVGGLSYIAAVAFLRSRS